MKALKKTFILAGYLAMVATSSCEIEDEFSNPDRSEHLGTKIFTGNSVPVALLWSENTNEIIVVNYDGITAIEAESKKVRKLSIGASNFAIQSAWLVGDTIYQLSSDGVISQVDLTTLSYRATLVDSAVFDVFSSPFTPTHFAYAKFNDMYEPSVFLYDLKTHKETYVGPGVPRVFSSDGKQLVISYHDFFVYDLTTKVIASLGFTDNGKLLVWSTDGLLSFQEQDQTVLGRNESTGVKIGEWMSIVGPYGGVVSPSGKHIIASDDECLYGNVTSDNCPNGRKVTHSIVDVNSDVEVPMAYTIDTYIDLRAFSPDEKTFVYAALDNSVYIAEPQN